MPTRVNGVDEHGGVVIIVEENEWFFPEHNEEGVAELDNLGQCKKEGPEGGNTVRITRIAQGVGQSVCPQVHEKVLNLVAKNVQINLKIHFPLKIYYISKI
jgi:hypothetical protein